MEPPTQKPTDNPALMKVGVILRGKSPKSIQCSADTGLV